MVTAGCFLPCLFIAPIAAAISVYARVPAFATLILIPLTFSITQGILWGFILHAVLHAVAGRAREVTAAAWGLAAVAIALLVIEHVH